MRKRTKSPVRTVTIYILIFILGVIVGNQILIPSEPVQQLTSLPVQNYSASANILAVKSVDNSGVLGKVTVEIYPGKGRVLMNTNPFLEPDTQFSAETAVNVAQDYTEKDLSDKDVIISFDIGGKLLGGPSAGAAMAIATILELENKTFNEGVTITGTLDENGDIGKVSGIVAKAEATEASGMNLLIVPVGQKTYTIYSEEKSCEDYLLTKICRTVTKPEDVDVEEKVGIRVVEASNIQEALKYFSV